uniref:F-box domain-containing protein n=1 Tax=Amblyomma maculatum TaxID=34609 RepID=G3MSR5_AMBMU
MPAALKMEVSLETLPTEILFKIFSLLDAQFVVEVASKLCTRFARLLSDNGFWKAKLATTWPKPYPVSLAEDFDWKEACVERELQFNRWTNWEEEMKSVHISEAHIGIINSILLMNGGSTCVTGSRDRSLKIWNMEDQGAAATEGDRLLHTAHDAHGGWILSLHCIGNTLMSSSIDSTVKLWDVECGLCELKSFTMSRPTLAMSWSDGEMILGCQDGKVYRYDPREPGEPSLCYKALRNAVICMAADDRMVLAATTGPCVHAVDRRCWRIRRDLSMTFKGDYVTAMSFDSRQLWLGTRGGNVHAIDMTSSPHRILESLDISFLQDGLHPPTPVTGIRHTLGSVLVSFQRAPMIVLEPTLSPAVIFRGAEWPYVARFDLEGGTLAVAHDEDLQVWRPKCEAM